MVTQKVVQADGSILERMQSVENLAGLTDEQKDELSKKNLLILEAKRIALLQARIEECQTEIDQIKQRILDTHEPGSYEADELTVQVREGAKRLDAKKFMNTFPASDKPEFYELKPALNVIKKHIAPTELEQYQTTSKPSVIVK
jgi:hypothetical protein